MNQYRSAIIGTGGIAGAHQEAIGSNAERVQLVAAVDPDAERLNAFCDRHAITGRYADAQAMLAAEKPDLVQICTPPATHLALIEAALDAGAWVLCEKPLCASLAELDRIEAAEARSGNYCSSVLQWRYGAGGQHLKRLIDAGALGRPLVMTCLTLWYRTAAYYAVPWRGKWATETGGTSAAHGIHAMDFMLWLLGEWAEVRAMVGTLVHDIEVDDVSMASVRFANGALANITNSAISPREESYLRFDFERATVELTHLYRYANDDWRFTMPLPLLDQEALADWREIGGVDNPNFHGRQLTAFLDSMDHNERPAASGDDIRRTLDFLASLYKSGITGQAVQSGSITPADPFYHHFGGLEQE
jgi:predicted dehydrogenase